ncbi:MAG: DUF4345 domain-containing protein [Pseudomonadota bacterium]
MKIFLILISLTLLVFGIIYLLSPEQFAAAAGLTGNASGMTDVRATYGGFQIGFAAFLMYCAMNTKYAQVGLVALAFVLGAVGASRLVGILVDGDFSGFHQIGLGFEAIVTAISVYFLSTLPKED